MEIKHEVRLAEEKDLPSIFKLINELAMYEKAPEEVTLTLAQLIEDYRQELFIAFVAEQNYMIHGMALIYPIYSTWKGISYYLEDIIVNEQFRRQGIGGLLFDEVVKYAKQKNAARLRWQVLDWNTPGIRFYEKYDAIFEKEWLSYKLTREQIALLS